MPVPARGCDPVFPICQCGREMSTLTTYHERNLVRAADGPHWVVVQRTFAICPARATELGHDSKEVTNVSSST